MSDVAISIDGPGTLRLTLAYDSGQVEILHADPQIKISATMLDMIRSGACRPHATLNGDVLRINGADRTVIYRIGEKVVNMLAYYVEWPD